MKPNPASNYQRLNIRCTSYKEEKFTKLQLVKSGDNSIIIDVSCTSGSYESTARYLSCYNGKDGLDYYLAYKLFPTEYVMWCSVDKLELKNDIEEGYYDIVAVTSKGRKLKAEKACNATSKPVIEAIRVADGNVNYLGYGDERGFWPFFSDNTGDYVAVYVYGLNLKQSNIPKFYDASGNKIRASYIDGDENCGYEHGNSQWNLYRLKKSTSWNGESVSSRATVEGDVIYTYNKENYCATYINSYDIFFEEYLKNGQLYDKSPGRLRIYIGEKANCDVGDIITCKAYLSSAMQIVTQTATVKRNKNGKYIEFGEESAVYKNGGYDELTKNGVRLNRGFYNPTENIQPNWNLDIPSGGSWEIHPVGNIIKKIYFGTNTGSSTATLSLNETQLGELGQYGTVRICIYDAVGERKDTKLVSFPETKGSSSESGSDNPSSDILPEDMPADGKIPESLWIANIDSAGYTYTGEAVIPHVRVYYGKTMLAEKTEYTVSFKNNVNVGGAAITVKGKGSYPGQKTESFQILPADIKECYAEDFYVKTGSKKQKPVPTLYYRGAKLKVNKDFTVSIDNKDGIYAAAGNYIVTIAGTGNYKETKQITLTAVANPVKKAAVSITKATAPDFVKSFTYTGKAIEQPSALKIKMSGKSAVMETLIPGDNYTVGYSNNIKAGTATVTYYGKNKYSGKLKKTYKILPYDIAKNADGKIECYVAPECALSKGGAKPKPVVKFDGKKLKEGTDYTLSYKNNKTVNGKNPPCVIISGKGNFKGKISINFKITQ